MDKNQQQVEAIKALKEKLVVLASKADFATIEFQQAMKQTGAAVSALSLAAGGIKTGYTHVSINKDWDPKDHPRDPNTGEFVKSATGYIFGKAKKAAFNLGASEDLEFDLHPGDVAFKTPGGNIIISHPDDSFSLVSPLTGSVTKIPDTGASALAAAASHNKLQKVAENPGTVVEASSKKEAIDKIAHPDQYGNTISGLTEPPALKPGKNAYTAKQIKEYQDANAGKEVAKDMDGLSIKSGSWVDVEGKPYLITASPYGKDKVLAYRWVSTKQQASNLVKEDLFTSASLSKKAMAIEDPTGKPYGVPESAGTKPEEVAKTPPKHGSLMTQAVVGAIPNASVAHKNYVANSKGSYIAIPGGLVSDTNNKPILSGSWVEIEGKPYQVHASPNEGNVALSKWVSTKQQASNNTYDFPHAVTGQGISIPDPTGTSYTPLPEGAKKAISSYAGGFSTDAGKAASMMKAYEEGDLLESDIQAVKDFGSEADSAAASAVLDQINNPSKDPMDLAADDPSAFISEYDKAESYKLVDDAFIGGLITPSLYATTLAFEALTHGGGDSDLTFTVPPVYSSMIPYFPEGTAISYGPDLLYVRSGSGWDGYSTASGDMAPGMSHSLMASVFAHKGDITIFPSGNSKVESIIESDAFQPVAEKVYLPSKGEFHLKGDTWFSKTGTPHDIGSEIGEYKAKAASLSKEIQAMEVGDKIIAVTLDTGVTNTYEKWNNLTSGDLKNLLTGESVSSTIFTESLSSLDSITAAFELAVVKSDAGDSGDVVGGESPETEDPETKSQQFVHPVSGDVFVMEPGDIVHKHKKNENAYIIERPGADFPIFFFNQFGKLYKPKQSQKNLDTGYSPVEDWPGKVEVSDTKSVQAESPATPSAGMPATETLFANAKVGDTVTFHVANGDLVEYVYVNSGWSKVGPISYTSHSSNAVWNFISTKTNGGTYYPVSGDAAPWGGPPAEPEVETKKKPAKKAKKGDLPTSYEFPGGLKIDLKPGQFLVKASNNDTGEVHYLKYTEPKSKYDNKYLFYNGAGTQVGNVWALGGNTPTSVKGNKVHGYTMELLANYPLKKQKIDFSEYKAEKDWTDVTIDNAQYWVSQQFQKFKTEIIPTTWSGAPQNYHETKIKDENGNPKSWSTLTSEERLSFIPEYKEMAAQVRVEIDALLGQKDDAYFKSYWGKNYKPAFVKTRSAMELIYRTALLAEEYLNPDTQWSDADFETALAEVQKASAKYKTYLGTQFDLEVSYPLVHFSALLTEAETKRKFKNSLSGIDFDPYNMSHETAVSYAQSKGLSVAPALSESVLKTWVLLDLGDPSLGSSMKATVDKAIVTAKAKIKLATLSATLADKIIVPDNSVPKVIGIHAKSMMKDSYVLGDGEGTSIKNTGADTWAVTSGGSVMEVNDAAVAYMVDSAYADGLSVNESDDFAYGTSDNIDLALDKTSQEFGFESWSDLKNSSATDLVNAIHSQFPNSDNVPSSHALYWFAFHATGDHVGKFNIEKEANGGVHPLASTHPGSPDSPTGKVAHAALASHLASMDWGVDFLKNGKTPGSLTLSWKEFRTSTYGTSVPLPPNAWGVFHPSEDLNNSLEAPLEVSASKPEQVPDDTWLLVSSVTSPDDLASFFGDDSENVTGLPESALDSGLSSNGFDSFALATTPLHMKQLAYWGLNYGANEVLQSVLAHADAGKWLDEKTPVWVGPNGKKFPISAGSKVYKAKDAHSLPPYGTEKFFISMKTGGDTHVKMVTADKVQNVAAYHVDTYLSPDNSEEIFTMPGMASWAQAKHDKPSLVESDWDLTESVEAGNSAITHHLTGLHLTSELKKSTALEKDYPYLYAQHKTLPENVRQAVLYALENGATGLLDVMEYKSKQGHYAGLLTKGLFDAGQPWIGNLSKGQTSSEDVSKHWSTAAKNGYVSFFGLSSMDDISGDLKARLFPESDAPVKVLPTWDDLSLTWLKSKSKGMHSGEIWSDQDGNQWMSKAFPSDPNGAARVDAEGSANKIGTLFGFGAPTVHVGDIKKKAAGNSSAPKYAYLQHMKPAKYDFAGVSPKDLTVSQLSQAMSEHVLDWIISNHDSHSGNLMLGVDNKVFGIDKGQAFRFFPDDKLAVGYKASNPVPTWYDDFYYGVQNGTIDKATADAVTKHVLRTAQKVSKDKDEEYRALLEEAFQNRDFWPDKYSTKAKFIDALVERKHNSFTDFVDFYKKVYAKSPYEFDIDTENLTPPALDAHTYIGVSTDYSQAVAKAGVHGKAMFFSTDDLEDSHLLMSTAHQKDGSIVLTGEAKVTKKGDKALTAWLANQTVEKKNVSHSTQSVVIEQAPDHEDPSFMPMTAPWFQSLVAGSKTVSSHNKNGDQSYNASTLSTMDTFFEQMTAAKKWLDDWEAANPDTPAKGSPKGIPSWPSATFEFQTMEQQKAWKSMLGIYFEYYEKVNAAKGTTNKISPHFTQPVYQPTKAALDELKAKKAASAGGGLGSFDNAPIGAVVKVGPAEYIKSPSGNWVKIGGKNSSNNFIKANWDSGNVKPVSGFPAAKPASPEEAPLGTVVKSGSMLYTKTAPEIWTADNGSQASGSTVKSAWKDLVFVSSPDAKVSEDEETSVEVTVGTKVLKVTYRPSAFANGKYNFENGKLELTGGETTGANGIDQSGHMYEIDFGTTKVFYRPWHGSNVNKAQQGMLRFERANWADSDYQSIEEIFDVLRQMGLDLDPADEESMELFYWQHMSEILDDRADGSNSKWGKVGQHLKNNLKEDMTQTEKLAVQKAAWALAIGQDRVDNADWLPKFSRNSPFAAAEEEGFTSGRPYWMRPDLTFEELKAIIGNKVASTNLAYGGNAEDALPIALSGSMLSSEERARYYGSGAKSGGSSASDQQKGSSRQVFTRPGSGDDGNHVIYHPRVYLRTSNYRFASDNFGDPANTKSSSHWDPQTAFKSGYEMCVKWSISVMDDVIMLRFPNETLRQQAINKYKGLGITHLHGIPIEKVFVVYGNESATENLKKVWEDSIKQEKEKANG